MKKNDDEKKPRARASEKILYTFLRKCEEDIKSCVY